jgi:DnaK suppressor protein
MKKKLLDFVSEAMQKQRRRLLRQAALDDESFKKMIDDRESELEEHAQEERISSVLKNLEDREQERLREIDAALARIEAGVYGKCENCGRGIDETRLRAIPTTLLCASCSTELDKRGTGWGEWAPESGRLPPDLDLLDDDEVRERLLELVRENEQVDIEELQIIARNGVIYLEGAIPSEREQEVLLRILTDIAGVQEVVDHLEIRRLAWERGDRSKQESAGDVQPENLPKKEPYGGTEDPVLANEEGVDYEPPANPPPPPHREE